MNTLMQSAGFQLRFFLFPVVLTSLVCSGVLAQSPVVAPRDSMRTVFDGAKIVVVFGKPSVRGRRIFGDVVPFYKVWRTGTGAATIFRTEADLEMDGAIIPRGEYSLYTIPAESRWKVIINKQVGQWGTEYHPEMDLARVEVDAQRLSKHVEDLSLRIDKTSGDEGALRLEWEQTAIAVPFKVSQGALLASPQDSAVIEIGGATLSVFYGRPSMRGRTIFGGVVPFGAVWRTGANAATSFMTTENIIIGGVAVPRGSYTMYSIPGAREWRVIINAQTGQWGTTYEVKRDIARVRAKRRSLKNAVERLTIELVSVGKQKGELRLSWEKTLVVLPIQIQEKRSE
jgi:hypothetical protein